MNIKNVIVPVDFSPPSRLAANYGISLARKFRARLTLLHVAEFPTGFTAGVPLESAKIEKEHKEQALRMLSALVAAEDQDDLDLRIVLKSGDVKDEIFSAIAEQHADIVVMGTHGRGLFGRLLIGSVTESILRKVSIPILTVSHATRPLAFKRILYATDLSESSKHGFSFALDMARMMSSDMVVVHVLGPVTVTYGGADMAGYISQYDIEEARTKLAELVGEANCQNVKIEPVIAEGVAAEEILKAAEDNTADLILVTVESKGRVERALLGTTAERVIREANVPVLSLPANAAVLAQEISNPKSEISNWTG